MTSKTDAEFMREMATEQFLRRYRASLKAGIVDNQSLPAESAMFFHCQSCGVIVDKLPEDYLFPPHTKCSQCAGFHDKDNYGFYLAKEMGVALGEIPEAVYDRETKTFVKKG
jgi:hypothetical protein